MKIITLLLFFNSAVIFASTNYTASEILDKSIEFAGGEENIMKISSIEYEYDITINDKPGNSLIEKRIQGKKYMKSFLSMDYKSNSIHFNGKSFATIDDTILITSKDKRVIENGKLLTYHNIQLGYKLLKYEITRIEDIKFNEFDCYVIKATSNKGYSTINYFDKSNFRLIMVIYPNKSKSLLVSFSHKDDILYHTQIMNIDSSGQKTIWTLEDFKTEATINKLWFNISTKENTNVPDDIKQGIFHPVFGTKTTVNRGKTIQTEVYNEGNSKFTLFVTWSNSNTMSLINLDSRSSNPDYILKKRDAILVKIPSWNSKGYVCHFLSNGNGGTQEYLKE